MTIQTTPLSLKLAKAVAGETDSDIYAYFGPINASGYTQLRKCVALNKKRPHITLMLVTLGGSAINAYQMARFLQQHYDQVAFFVPAFCKSAGTLACLGAHKLVLGQEAELGPIDVQLPQRATVQSALVGDCVSGLNYQAAINCVGRMAGNAFRDAISGLQRSGEECISIKEAAEMASPMVASLFGHILNNVDPMMLGHHNRANTEAVDYGMRLIGQSGNLTEDLVHHLASGYPTHDFAIDRAEAKQMFLNTEEPSVALNQLAVELLTGSKYDVDADPYVGCLSAKQKRKACVPA